MAESIKKVPLEEYISHTDLKSICWLLGVGWCHQRKASFEHFRLSWRKNLMLPTLTYLALKDSAATSLEHKHNSKLCQQQYCNLELWRPNQTFQSTNSQHKKIDQVFRRTNPVLCKLEIMQISDNKCILPKKDIWAWDNVWFFLNNSTDYVVNKKYTKTAKLVY